MPKKPLGRKTTVPFPTYPIAEWAQTRIAIKEVKDANCRISAYVKQSSDPVINSI
jgi:hypothetical protein